MGALCSLYLYLKYECPEDGAWHVVSILMSIYCCYYYHRIIISSENILFFFFLHNLGFLSVSFFFKRENPLTVVGRGFPETPMVPGWLSGHI